MVEIVAELAQGFEGNVEKALLLLDAAHKSGADCAKFQVIFADEICTPSYEYYDLFKSLEMSDYEWLRIADLSRNLGIRLILDVFGETSLQLALLLKVDSVMLHATDVTNIPLLTLVSDAHFDHVYVGVGGSTMDEVKSMLTVMKTNRIILMTGFQAYPTEDDELNLTKIKILKNFVNQNYNNVEVGFGDHSLPESLIFEQICSMALGLGASVIEKHLTLSKIMKMEDFEAAVNPDRFALFVNNLRKIDKSLASNLTNFNVLSEGEAKYRKFVRRQVVASRSLNTGDKFQLKDLVMKRTGLTDGFDSANDIIGLELNSDIGANEHIKRSVVNAKREKT